MKTTKRSDKLNLLSGWRLWVLWPMSVVMRLWTMTYRIEWPEELAEFVNKKDRQGALFLFWHNRLFLVSELYKRMGCRRRIHGLVSASKDGSWLTAFFKLLGIGAVRGSSSWRGSRAIIELQQLLLRGEDVAITPDGPRGPCYSFKEGPVLLAKNTNAPVWVCSATCYNAWRLKSWDRFYLPKPFSKIIIHVIEVSYNAERPLTVELLKAKLDAITEDL